MKMDKKELRIKMKKIRNGISDEAREGYAQSAKEQFFRKIDVSGYDWFYLYIPYGSELSTWPVILKLWEMGKRVAAPRVLGNEEYPCMEFFEIRTKEDLREGFQGILEPCGAGFLVPEGRICMLLPGLAFSRDGKRLGYGGGYYDCYLGRYKEKEIDTSGFCYDVQVVEELFTEEHDMLLKQLIVAENGKDEEFGK